MSAMKEAAAAFEHAIKLNERYGVLGTSGYFCKTLPSLEKEKLFARCSRLARLYPRLRRFSLPLRRRFCPSSCPIVLVPCYALFCLFPAAAAVLCSEPGARSSAAAFSFTLSFTPVTEPLFCPHSADRFCPIAEQLCCWGSEELRNVVLRSLPLLYRQGTGVLLTAVVGEGRLLRWARVARCSAS